MRELAILLIIVTIIAAFVSGLASAGFSFGNLIVDDSGLAWRDPQSEARAAAIAQESADMAAQRAVERRALELQNDVEQRAQPAAVLGKALTYTGLGLGALILAVGLAFAGVAWANKHATSIYPNAAGQYPVIVRRGFGWVTFHDPNRGLGPAAVYRTPTMLDVLASAVATVRGLAAPRPQVQASFPAPADQEAMLQVASQAQAVGLMAAATRPSGILNSAAPHPKEARQLVKEMVQGTGPALSGRMPAIRVIDDQAQADKLLMLFEGE